MTKHNFESREDQNDGVAVEASSSGEKKVKLLKPHTHEGKFRLPGEFLTVDKPTFDFLTSLKIGEAA